MPARTTAHPPRVARRPARVPAALAGTVAGLDEIIAQLDGIRAAASGDRRYGFDEPWAVFSRRMRMLPSQSYGVRIQQWLTEFYGWTSVPASADRGDVRDATGAHWEVKVTFLTVTNRLANFVQIRPHQRIAGYELFVITDDMDVVRFHLTRAQMHAELGLLGSLAHGTSAAAAGHTNREYAIRLDLSSMHGQRWLRQYHVASGITATSYLPA